MQTKFDLKIDDVIFRALQLNFTTKPEEERHTLIFLHDSLGCIKLWRDFPEQVGQATQCDVLIYDRQGYGLSSPFNSDKRNNYYLEKEANILNKILEKLKIKKAILFGHSDGGSISLIAAAKYPTKIAGIITEGAHVFVEDITLNGIREVVDAYKNTDLKNKLSKYHGTKVEAVFTAWSQTWLHPEYKDWNIEKFLSEIHCPSLIIQVANDEFGSEKQ